MLPMSSSENHANINPLSDIGKDTVIAQIKSAHPTLGDDTIVAKREAFEHAVLEIKRSDRQFALRCLVWCAEIAAVSGLMFLLVKYWL
jgi:hypothetical protein